MRQAWGKENCFPRQNLIVYLVDTCLGRIAVRENFEEYPILFNLKQMDYPKILSAVAIDNHTLLIEFEDKKKKTYDIRPLLKKMFVPLKNYAFFKTVSVDSGGYAVVWNSNIDLSEYELWLNSKAVQKRTDFRYLLALTPDP